MFWDEGNVQVVQTFRAAVNRYRGSREIAGPCGTGAASHRTVYNSFYFVLPHDVPVAAITGWGSISSSRMMYLGPRLGRPTGAFARNASSFSGTGIRKARGSLP